MKLLIGAATVSIFVRHSRSLKDKRQITKSIIQKLRNEGFSAVEYQHTEDHKRASIGYSFVSADGGFLDTQMEKAQRFFIGDFEILLGKSQTFEMEEEFVPEPESEYE